VKDRKQTHYVKTVAPPKTKLTKLESGLTQMQEDFCRNFVFGFMTQTEAAEKAGYQDAAVVASRFMNGRDFPKVIDRIRELEKSLAKQHEVTYESHITQLARIRDLAIEQKALGPAVAAEKQRGMAAGLYISRSEILVGKIDQMSREEVLAELQKLHEQYPALKQAMLPPKEIDLVPNREKDVSVLEESDGDDDPLDKG
jgi:phage terminase small subunit